MRHALPGERVVVEVTEGQEGDRFLRADAVEVLEASPDRVTPPCPFSGPDACGGCDFQHVALPAQRALKADVVAEQLQTARRPRRRGDGGAGPGRRGRARLADPGAVGGHPRRGPRAAQAPLPRRGRGRRLPHRAPRAAPGHRHRVARRDGRGVDRLLDRPAAPAGHDAGRGDVRRRAAGAHRGGRRADLAGHRLGLLAGAPRCRRHARGRRARRARPAAGRARGRPLLRGGAVHRRARRPGRADRSRGGRRVRRGRRRGRAGEPSRPPPGLAGPRPGGPGAGRGRHRAARPRRPRPAAHRREAGRRRRDRRARPPRGGVRRLRPGRAGPRRGVLRRAGLHAAVAARVRPVPDDAPRRVRRGAGPRRIVYLDVKRY